MLVARARRRDRRDRDELRARPPPRWSIRPGHVNCPRFSQDHEGRDRGRGRRRPAPGPRAAVMTVACAFERGDERGIAAAGATRLRAVARGMRRKPAGRLPAPAGLRDGVAATVRLGSDSRPRSHPEAGPGAAVMAAACAFERGGERGIAAASAMHSPSTAPSRGPISPAPPGFRGAVIAATGNERIWCRSGRCSHDRRVDDRGAARGRTFVRSVRARGYGSVTRHGGGVVSGRAYR